MGVELAVVGVVVLVEGVVVLVDGVEVLVVVGVDVEVVVTVLLASGSDCAPKVVEYEPVGVSVGMRTWSVTSICLPDALASASPLRRMNSAG